MKEGFVIQIIAHEKLTSEQSYEALLLCSEVYEEPFAPFEPWANHAVHLLGYLDDKLVSHAMWVERYLQPTGLPPLRTAYVEAVATRQAYQQRGFGTAIMRRLQAAIVDYDLGGLSENPDFRHWYQRLGWESWRGPLSIRSDQGLVATPEDYCMILRLPRTPMLDLNVSLSAEWRTGELW